MDRHYQLKVTSDTTNIDVDSVDADEVARIVQLAGLKSSPDSFETSHSLAPVSTQLPNIPPVSDPMMSPVAEPGILPDDHSGDQTGMEVNPDDHSNEVTEENAEYDFGHHKHAGSGNEVDTDSYLWTADRLPQHFGKSGDNTLNDPISEAAQTIYDNLSKAYKSFLAEESMTNDTGTMSPLSDPDIEDFDKDPMANEPIVDDGSHSPMSTIKRQPALK